MADKKQSSEHEAHVRGVAPPGVEQETDEHGLTVLRVSEGDKAEPDPLHAGPKKLGLPDTPFDPNAALRKKTGGIGLQDSEALRPAVWVDADSEEARNAAADRHVQDAERALEQAKERAAAIKKGEPIDREIP